jgi:hypothetical protein
MRDAFQINGLKNLCRWANLNNSKGIAIEIGAYSGEGTSILSNYFERVVAIDPWENGYDKNDLASEQLSMDLIFKSFLERTNKIKNIKYIPTTSAKAIKHFSDNTIDFLYIDGDHQYEFVKNDLILWKNKVKKNGIIAGHDFSFNSVKTAIFEEFPDKTIELFDGDSWAFIL